MLGKRIVTTNDYYKQGIIGEVISKAWFNNEKQWKYGIDFKRKYGFCNTLDGYLKEPTGDYLLQIEFKLLK